MMPKPSLLSSFRSASLIEDPVHCRFLGKQESNEGSSSLSSRVLLDPAR